MVKRIGSLQRKTRHKFMQHFREKGKISLSRFFQEFKEGELVDLKISPIVQAGRFFRRFHGMSGVVMGKRGFCYEVKINDCGKEKLLMVHPMHMHKA